MFTPTVSIDAFGSVLNPSDLIMLTLVLTLKLMLRVNGAIEIKVFLSSIDASVNARVTLDGRCKYTLRENDTALVMTQLKNCMVLHTHIFSGRIFIKSQQTNSHYIQVF